MKCVTNYLTPKWDSWMRGLTNLNKVCKRVMNMLLNRMKNIAVVYNIGRIKHVFISHVDKIYQRKSFKSVNRLS